MINFDLIYLLAPFVVGLVLAMPFLVIAMAKTFANDKKRD